MRARILGLAAWYTKLLKKSVTLEELGRSLVAKCLIQMETKVLPNRRTEPGSVKIVVHPSTFQKLHLAEHIPYSFKDLFEDPDETRTKKFSDLLFLLSILEYGGLLAGIKLETDEGKALVKNLFGGYEVDSNIADFDMDSELQIIEALILKLKKGSAQILGREEESEGSSGEETEGIGA